MIRVGELALFLAPLALFLLYRRVGGADRLAPSRTALVLLLAGLVAIGVTLAWDGVRERHAEGTRYEPARLRDGRVVPGSGS